MARAETHTRGARSLSGGLKAPNVLVALVVKDGAGWLRQCLVALSRQTHPRMGVLAVDNGSSDGSLELLQSALGQERVLRPRRNIGFAGAIAEILRAPAASQADYFLFLHDDTLLAPDAVASMVEAAERIDGVGVVGPKVLDWDQPRVIREIGLSTDRFGYEYSPLEDGEIDQGQYDRVREVLFVSSAAMLVSRRAWARIGPPDERYGSHHEDMDFCWRARLAGFRVLMTPRAVARHRGASFRGERAGTAGAGRGRFWQERAALASILKNYGLLSLLWILPAYVAQGTARIVLLLASRRFEDAYQVAAAWGWNLVHLPGTVRRRVRAQAVRAVGDHSIHRYMAPAGIRLRRWAAVAAQALLPGAPEADQGEPVPGRVRAARFALDHPVATAAMLSVLLGAVAYRHLLGASPLMGGGLAAFPSSPAGFFRELFSGLRNTGLGGTHPASPALGLLGIGSVLSFGSPSLLQKVLLLVLPAVGAVGCYRAVRRLTGMAAPGVISGAAYGLSSAVLWGLSEGRIPVLVLLAGLPWMRRKLAEGFDGRPGAGPLRWTVGTALGLAVLGSFYPGAALAAAVVVLSFVIVPTPSGAARARGLLLVAGAAVAAAVLALPVALDIARSGGEALSDRAGEHSFDAISRLTLGPGPGAWPMAAYLPLAAAVALVFVRGAHARPAARAAITIAGSIYLAWAAAAGYLPAALSNPVAYIAVATLDCAVLIGMGFGALMTGVAQQSFGHRQLGAALLGVVVMAGLIAQTFEAAKGSWVVGGPERLPAAYPAVAQSGGARARILWLGRPDGEAFTAPGGWPDGVVGAGPASVRYAVTYPNGSSALDFGRAASGAGYDYLRLALAAILSGRTRHGGALLSSLGIRYVVAAPEDIGEAALRRLDEQVDTDRLPEIGLTLFRNDRALPPASVISEPGWVRSGFSRGLDSAAALPAPNASPLEGGGQTWGGSGLPGGSVVLLSQQFDRRWTLTLGPGGAVVRPRPALGWAVGFATAAPATSMEVRFTGQQARRLEVLLIGLMWLIAMWLIRKPVRGG